MALIRAADINKQIGRRNTKRVREYMRTHIGATRIECAKALDMNVCVIGRHVGIIRNEWVKKRRRK